MNVERHQAVVIGGGPAGLAAAIQDLCPFASG